MILKKKCTKEINNKGNNRLQMKDKKKFMATTSSSLNQNVHSLGKGYLLQGLPILVFNHNID